MIKKITGWVVLVCCGVNKWSFLPKIYDSKVRALSGMVGRKRGYWFSGKLCLDPVKITFEIEVPSCDECEKRFGCFTE